MPLARRFRLTVAVAAATVVMAAGCGGASSTGSGKGAEHAMPAGALVYADVNLDTGSAGWKQFAAVGRRFPGWQRLVGNVLGSLGHGGSSTTNVSLAPTITFKTDIEPWLGDSAGLAVTSLDASTGSAHAVVYVASKDDAKAKDFLHKEGDRDHGSYGGYDLLTATTGSDHLAIGHGALLASNDDQTLRNAIDTLAGKGDDITTDASFHSAMKALPSNSVVRGWVNAPKLAELAGMASLGGGLTGAGGNAQVMQFAKALQSVQSLSFAAWASAGGYHLTFRGTLAPGADSSLFPAPHASSLTALVPSDAFAYLALGGFDTYLRQALSDGSGASGPALKQFQHETGISVKNDLIPLLAGDDLVYAAPGVPVRAAVVLKPADPGRASATMRKLTALIAGTDPGVRVTALPSGQRIDANGFVVTWQRTSDGLITIGNDPAAGTPPSAPLASSSDYTALLAKAGAPAGANVALYFNLAGMLRLFPIDTDPNLQHVGGVVAWSSQNGQQRSSDVFVEVR